MLTSESCVCDVMVWDAIVDGVQTTLYEVYIFTGPPKVLKLSSILGVLHRLALVAKRKVEKASSAFI